MGFGEGFASFSEKAREVGEKAAEAMKVAFEKLEEGVEAAAKATADAVQKASDASGQAAGKAGETIGDAASIASQAAMDGAGTAGQAAMDDAGTAGQAIVDGACAASQAAMDGAGTAGASSGDDAGAATPTSGDGVGNASQIAEDKEVEEVGAASGGSSPDDKPREAGDLPKVDETSNEYSTMFDALEKEPSAYEWKVETPDEETADPFGESFMDGVIGLQHEVAFAGLEDDLKEINATDIGQPGATGEEAAVAGGDGGGSVDAPGRPEIEDLQKSLDALNPDYNTLPHDKDFDITKQDIYQNLIDHLREEGWGDETKLADLRKEIALLRLDPRARASEGAEPIVKAAQYQLFIDHLRTPAVEVQPGDSPSSGAPANVAPVETNVEPIVDADASEPRFANGSESAADPKSVGSTRAEMTPEARTANEAIVDRIATRLRSEIDGNPHNTNSTGQIGFQSDEILDKLDHSNKDRVNTCKEPIGTLEAELEAPSTLPSSNAEALPHAVETEDSALSNIDANLVASCVEITNPDTIENASTSASADAITNSGSQYKSEDNIECSSNQATSQLGMVALVKQRGNDLVSSDMADTPSNTLPGDENIKEIMPEQFLRISKYGGDVYISDIPAPVTGNSLVKTLKASTLIALTNAQNLEELVNSPNAEVRSLLTMSIPKEILALYKQDLPGRFGDDSNRYHAIFKDKTTGKWKCEIDGTLHPSRKEAAFHIDFEAVITFPEIFIAAYVNVLGDINMGAYADFISSGEPCHLNKHLLTSPLGMVVPRDILSDPAFFSLLTEGLITKNMSMLEKLVNYQKAMIGNIVGAIGQANIARRVQGAINALKTCKNSNGEYDVTFMQRVEPKAWAVLPKAFQDAISADPDLVDGLSYLQKQRIGTSVKNGWSFIADGILVLKTENGLLAQIIEGKERHRNTSTPAFARSVVQNAMNSRESSQFIDLDVVSLGLTVAQGQKARLLSDLTYGMPVDLPDTISISGKVWDARVTRLKDPYARDQLRIEYRTIDPEKYQPWSVIQKSGEDKYYDGSDWCGGIVTLDFNIYESTENHDHIIMRTATLLASLNKMYGIDIDPQNFMPGYMIGTALQDVRDAVATVPYRIAATQQMMADLSEHSGFNVYLKNLYKLNTADASDLVAFAKKVVAGGLPGAGICTYTNGYTVKYHSNKVDSYKYKDTWNVLKGEFDPSAYIEIILQIGGAKLIIRQFATPLNSDTTFQVLDEAGHIGKFRSIDQFFQDVQGLLYSVHHYYGEVEAFDFDLMAKRASFTIKVGGETIRGTVDMQTEVVDPVHVTYVSDPTQKIGNYSSFTKYLGETTLLPVMQQDISTIFQANRLGFGSNMIKGTDVKSYHNKADPTKYEYETRLPVWTQKGPHGEDSIDTGGNARSIPIRFELDVTTRTVQIYIQETGTTTFDLAVGGPIDIVNLGEKIASLKSFGEKAQAELLGKTGRQDVGFVLKDFWVNEVSGEPRINFQLGFKRAGIENVAFSVEGSFNPALLLYSSNPDIPNVIGTMLLFHNGIRDDYSPTWHDLVTMFDTYKEITEFCGAPIACSGVAFDNGRFKITVHHAKDSPDAKEGYPVGREPIYFHVDLETGGVISDTPGLSNGDDFGSVSLLLDAQFGLWYGNIETSLGKGSDWVQLKDFEITGSSTITDHKVINFISDTRYNSYPSGMYVQDGLVGYVDTVTSMVYIDLASPIFAGKNIDAWGLGNLADNDNHLGFYQVGSLNILLQLINHAPDGGLQEWSVVPAPAGLPSGQLTTWNGHVDCFVFYVQKTGLGPIKPVWVNLKTGGIGVGLPGRSFFLNINI